MNGLPREAGGAARGALTGADRGSERRTVARFGTIFQRGAPRRPHDAVLRRSEIEEAPGAGSTMRGFFSGRARVRGSPPRESPIEKRKTSTTGRLRRRGSGGSGSFPFAASPVPALSLFVVIHGFFLFQFLRFSLVSFASFFVGFHRGEPVPLLLALPAGWHCVGVNYVRINVQSHSARRWSPPLGFQRPEAAPRLGRG